MSGVGKTFSSMFRTFSPIGMAYSAIKDKKPMGLLSAGGTSMGLADSILGASKKKKSKFSTGQTVFSGGASRPTDVGFG